MPNKQDLEGPFECKRQHRGKMSVMQNSEQEIEEHPFAIAISQHEKSQEEKEREGGRS